MMVDDVGVFSFVSADTDPTIQVRKLIAENTKRHSKNLPVWHDIAGSGHAGDET